MSCVVEDRKVSPRGSVGANGMDSVADVGSEGGFVGVAAGKEVVTRGIERFAAAAKVTSEFGRKAWKAKFALSS